MRVLVTGGFGYVGHTVSQDLTSAGYEVSILTHSHHSESAPLGSEVLFGDLRDRARMATIIRDGNFDYIVHLAGLARARESFDEPLAYYEVNVGGTINLLQALDDLDEGVARPGLVYASTTLVYGSRHCGLIDENTELNPETPYAETKVSSEKLIQAYANSGKIGAAVLRIFNVAGGTDTVTDTDFTRIIPNLLRAAAGEIPFIRLVGNGIAARDFIHVADVATAIRACLDTLRPGMCPTFNIGSGQASRIIDVLHCVEEISGRTIPIENIPQEVAAGAPIADIRAAERELGWEPKRSDLNSIISDAWNAWRLRH